VPARTPALPPDDAVLLPLAEVAYIIRCSVATVSRLVAAGKLPTVPGTATGARRLVRWASLDAYPRAEEPTESQAEERAESPAAAPASIPPALGPRQGRVHITLEATPR
jgi:hypothetical protein